MYRANAGDTPHLLQETEADDRNLPPLRPPPRPLPVAYVPETAQQHIEVPSHMPYDTQSPVYIVFVQFQIALQSHRCGFPESARIRPCLPHAQVLGRQMWPQDSTVLPSAASLRGFRLQHHSPAGRDNMPATLQPLPAAHGADEAAAQGGYRNR